MTMKRINNIIVNNRVYIHIRIIFDTWKIEVENQSLKGKKSV
jgi:hypothetical protein